MTCIEFDATLDDYLAGALPTAAAEAMEAHAAVCARCEQILEHRTRVHDILPTVVVPDEVRSQVLGAIAARRRARGLRRTLGAFAAVAAVALFAMMSRPATKSAADFPGASSVLLAGEHARPELAALDAAEREIRDALRASPDDTELRDGLARVTARRAALSRLIREAAS